MGLFPSVPSARRAWIRSGTFWGKTHSLKSPFLCFDSSKETLRKNIFQTWINLVSSHFICWEWDGLSADSNCLKLDNDFYYEKICRRQNVEYCNNSIHIPPFLWSSMKEILWCIFGEEWQKLQLQICFNREEKRRRVELKSSKAFHCVQMPRCILTQRETCFGIIQSILKSIQDVLKLPRCIYVPAT